ncbi:MAG: hypothetical protein GY943_25100 [Chloroflexi bacterium]|nr:hypothetical protein [Chloroflexota bacterium]
MQSKSGLNKSPLLILAILTLLTGMWAGLLRMGWQWPALSPTLPMSHGPLMVSGFLGTLIAVERAVALALVLTDQKKWHWTLYLGPIATLVGAILLLVGNTAVTGPLLMTFGSLSLVIVFGIIYKKHPALHTGTMALGAITWLVGNALWLFGRPIHQAVWWWAAFLILTIAGERLELSRIRKLTAVHQRLFGTAVVIILIGLIILIFSYSIGVRVTGLGFIALAAWLLRYDIVRMTIKQQGLPRYIAYCLLVGYIWLGISGIMALAVGGVSAGLLYDAILHAIFLGFVFSMIFGHAPIIFPSILQIPLVYRPAFYVHLTLLHITLLLRVIGDLTTWVDGRRWGGLLNAVVLLLFLANTAVSLNMGRKSQTQL